MTAHIPTDRLEREALAGEYVLGTLDARMSRDVAAALRSDDGLRRSVIAWEDRLAPLSRLALQEAAPAGLWDRIEAGLPGGVAVAPPARQSWFASPKLWRAWAIGASLAAAAFAGIAALQATHPTVMEAKLPVPVATPLAPATSAPSALAVAPKIPAAPGVVPTQLATQPTPDTGIRSAATAGSAAVRPAAGESSGVLRPSGSGDDAPAIRH